ncbi:MAG: extracellular solute-binding protein [Bacteroidales bacterium]|nr:extracellular solute-binding protein [Bacteroidales bacterium]
MWRLVFLFSVIFLSSCDFGKNSADSNTITIFHAGSLSYPLREVIKDFNLEHSDIKVLTESSGSVAAARKITDLNRICDIYATADYKVIEELLYPDHADWYIAFARNELSVVFTDKSKYAAEITTGNWHEILQRPGVRFGRSDPNADPCGYRTLLMWQLAQNFYNLHKFYDQMLGKDTRFIRPKEVDLLALLETYTIDYVFLYRSVAEQHGLNYLILPDSINLGNPEFHEHYRTASVEVQGTAPGEKIKFYGEPMVYAVTIPSKAPYQDVAEIFLDFLLHQEKGLRIMEENGQPAIIPCLTDQIDNLPLKLIPFCIPF